MSDEPPETSVRANPRPLDVRVIRRAIVRVVDGPDRGAELELGERSLVVIGSHADCDLVLTDTTVSRRHAELRLEPTGYVLRDLGSTNGTTLGGVRIREIIFDRDPPPFEVGSSRLQLEIASEETPQVLSAVDNFGDVIGHAPEMRHMFALLARVAPTESTILLTGESGTGKEIIAQEIHRQSQRAGAPFVVVDCGSVAESLIESELFGHEAGAFTSAIHERAGLFADASGGTVFLDEIGELPLALQPKLLRALAEGEVRRIGASAPTRIDVRVIAATNRDLARSVAEGTFRADLYFRLAVVTVRVPPLRMRPGDIQSLAHRFVARMRSEEAARELLTPSVIAALTSYEWPGNVRELRNVVERLLTVGELASAVRTGGPSVPDDYHTSKRHAIDRFERSFVQGALDACNGVVTRAAERSGISRQMFYRLMRRHGIEGRD
jgi:two-component system, NtrC family, response regulator GlrR